MGGVGVVNEEEDKKVGFYRSGIYYESFFLKNTFQIKNHLHNSSNISKKANLM